MIKFNSFHEMMEDQQGLSADGFSFESYEGFEECSDYVCLYACSGNAPIAEAFALAHGLYVVTECITDTDDDSTCCYYNRGFAWVNRERYFFTKKNDNFELEEVIEMAGV